MDNYLPAEIPAYLQPILAGLPEDLRAKALEMYKPDSSGGFPTIAFPRFGQIALRDGGTETIWPMQDPFYFVILAKNPRYHRQWYGGVTYEPGTNTPPVAQWYDGDEVPANVDPKALADDAPLTYRASWKRRLVVAIARHNSAEGTFDIGWDKPYIMDLGGKSCFKKGYPELNRYSYSGFEAWCEQHGVAICSLLLKINFDQNENVPVVNITPATYQDGSPAPLQAGIVHNIVLKGLSPEVSKLLQVARIDGTSTKAQAPAPQPQAQPQYQAPAAQPQYSPEQAQTLQQAQQYASAQTQQATMTAEQIMAAQMAEYQAQVAAQQAAAQQAAVPQAAPVDAPVGVASFGGVTPVPAAQTMSNDVLLAAAQASQNAQATLAAAPPAPVDAPPAPANDATAIANDIESVLNDIGAL